VTRPRGRVCFHVPYLYPLVSGGAVGYTGGMEVQQSLLAQGLGREGFEVTVVTCDYGQPPRIRHDGVTYIRSFPPHAGLPGVRFFHPRLTRTVAALHAAAADVYFMQGSGLLAGVTCDVAHARRAPFVFLAAHDWDTLRSMPYQTRIQERWWYTRALRGCDLRLAQTEWQRESLRREWGLESLLLRNPVELPATTMDPGRDGTVVWLATYKASKRPDWFVEIARRLPERRFVMCGVIPEPPLSSEHYDAARAAAREVGNLQVRGFLDHGRLVELLREASLLVHTSPAEGFPNVLLEAWSHGLPTVSGVDPDGVIRENRIGEVAETLDAFAESVAGLMADRERRREMGRRARAYVETRHAPAAIDARLANLLDALVATTGGPGAPAPQASAGA
jgi:glycosyltransferase involved in cell wall biosynthesis